jgi:hypothetical protein
MPFARHQSSGRVSVPGALASVPLALLAGAAAGALYQVLVLVVPFLKLSVLLGVLAGMGGCFLVQAVLKHVGRSRSAAFNAVVGLLAAVAGLAASYLVAFQFDAPDNVDLDLGTYLAQRGGLDALADPSITAHYTFRNGDPPGLVLTIWIIEALCFLSAGIAAGVIASRAVYCERCGKFTTSRDAYHRAPVANAMLKTEIANGAGSLAAVLSLPPSGMGQLVVRTHVCPTCQAALAFDVVELNPQPKVRERVALRNAVMTPEAYNTLLQAQGHGSYRGV